MKKIFAVVFILVPAIVTRGSISTTELQLDTIIMLLGLILWYLPEDKRGG